MAGEGAGLDPAWEYLMTAEDIKEVLEGRAGDTAFAFNGNLDHVGLLAGHLDPSDASAAQFTRPIELSIVRVVTNAGAIATQLRLTGGVYAREEYDLNPSKDFIASLDPQRASFDANVRYILGKTTFSLMESEMRLGKLLSNKAVMTGKCGELLLRF